jgi:hypothetical protein
VNMSMRAINECNEGATISLCSELTSIAKALISSSEMQILRIHLLKNFRQYNWTPKEGVNLPKFKILVSLGNEHLMPDHQLNALIDMTNTHKIKHSYLSMHCMNEFTDFSPALDGKL